MYTIIHSINGQETYKKELPIGTMEEHVEASNAFHELVYDVLDLYFRVPNSDLTPQETYPADIIRMHMSNNTPLELKDADGNIHHLTYLDR